MGEHCTVFNLAVAFLSHYQVLKSMSRLCLRNLMLYIICLVSCALNPSVLRFVRSFQVSPAVGMTITHIIFGHTP